MKDHSQSLVSDFIKVPKWIEQDLTVEWMESIQESLDHGHDLDSGAYMPAVTYGNAIEVMSEHGDDVMEYLDEIGIQIEPDMSGSWGMLCVRFLSSAVECWVSSNMDEVREAIEESEDCDE